MQYCPVCESSLNQYLQCLRCGSDLSVLHAIQAESRQHLFNALQAHVKGDRMQANLELEATQELNNNQLTISIACLIVDTNRQSSTVFDKETLALLIQDRL